MTSKTGDFGAVSGDEMNHSEMFSVVAVGPATWEVRHEVTFESAGLIRRTPRGFALYDFDARPVGVFSSISGALESLYELA